MLIAISPPGNYLIFYSCCLLSHLLIQHKKQYTSGLAIFDALGVDLVHGWISDPRDDITYKTLHGKSYNQLMDLVIKGRDATEEIRNILMTIEHKTADLLRSNHSAETANKDHPTNADWVEISEMDITETSSSNQTEKKDASSTLSTSNLLPSCSREEADRDSNLNHVENCNENSEVSSSNSAEITDSNKLIEEVSHLQKELKRNQEIETAAHIISNFLNDSSHQLTIVGLEKLSEYISDGQFCVFFRNNHFSTITKHNGHLFLLVTDLGYANVNEVVWEKLDDINGDTDYADCEFKKPRPRSTMTPSVPLLPPETVLTQQRQQDRDLQLAIRLSEGEALDDEALDEEEAALVEAAKELSLHSYNQMSTDVWSDTKPKAESASTVTDDNCSPTDTQQQEESSDYKLALQLQQQQEDLFMPQIVISDEALARQLEAEERVAAVSARRNPRPVNRNNNNVTRKSDRGSTCTVS